MSLPPSRPSDSDLGTFLQQNLDTELLRFTTAGSVDDGKSTLIGRLLHDSKSVYEDHLASVVNSRINHSSGPVDFALLTDGLRAEREQGITIDVAYRYFATARRRFIVADTPGHEQYTRNMVTGASTADLAVILIDSTKGILDQTRRHAAIASLLGISTIVGAINKMDLMLYREDVFVALEKAFHSLATGLGVINIQCIPISALEGDNVVQRSEHMLWYGGPTLLEHLEMVPLPSATVEALRFPVQMVSRPDPTFRGFAGRIAGGAVKPGDCVLALPSGRMSHIRSIVSYDGDLPCAFSPMSITVRLQDEIDLSRGDMLVSPRTPPHVSRQINAMVVWLHEQPMQLATTYLVKHANRQTKIKAIRIKHRVNMNNFILEPTAQLQINDIASVKFETHAPLFFDAYHKNRTTGSFILIDPSSNATLGAGLIQEETHSIGSFEGEKWGEAPEIVYSPLFSASAKPPCSHARAVLFLKKRFSLAKNIECNLLDQGFHVLLISGNELPATLLLRIIHEVTNAGFILVCSSESYSAEQKSAITSAHEDYFFDFTETELPQTESAAVIFVMERIKPAIRFN